MSESEFAPSEDMDRKESRTATPRLPHQPHGFRLDDIVITTEKLEEGDDITEVPYAM